MERFAQRESVLLGYSPQRSFESSSRKSDTNSDMDFSDVFGGPPRRFSTQESRARYSFSEAAMDSEPEDDTGAPSRNPWSLSDEKPVFGAESVNRRTHHGGDDFFDDIFKGDESKSFHSPRRSSRDFFAPSPGSSSLGLSPSRPLPSKAEPFGSSLPAKFSLPAKATKATDYSPLGSSTTNFSQSNGQASSTSHSRFSCLATELQEEMRYDRPLYRKSPLSQQVPNSNQDDEKNMDTKLEKSESKEVVLNSAQFHFSIYKWAGSGVPLLMSLGGNGSGNSRFRDRFRADRCSSSNGRIESDSNERVVSVDTESDNTKENKVESRSEGNGIAESEAIPKKNNQEESHSEDKANKKESYMNKGQTSKTEPEPFHVFLSDDNWQQGIAAEGKDTKVKSKNTANVSTSKKNDAKSSNSLQKSQTNSGDAVGGSRVKGKIGEFVKLFEFDQESTGKPKDNFGSQSNRWKRMSGNAKENGVTNAFKTYEKVHMLNKTKVPETSSSRKDDNSSKNKGKQESHSNTTSRKTSGLSTNEKNASQFSESLPNNNGIKVEDRDDSFHGYLLVEELSQIEEKVSGASEESEQIQASNAKIQQWSSGRKGNIRSLLSTLQFVLWPGSGWKPVPLVDLIEGSAVKRAYQRALLCLHPDKLQQKGAASHQKHLAQQVFDILQEAWDLFNTLGAI